MEGEATLIVTVGKSCRREGPGRLLEILLGLFQIEFHSVEMLKDRLITYKLEMMEWVGDCTKHLLHTLVVLKISAGI